MKINFQISKLCNQSNHDKIAPTKQNLICRGKSAMELITNDDQENHDAAQPRRQSNNLVSSQGGGGRGEGDSSW